MTGQYEPLIEERLSLSRLVTPYQSKKTPVYRWYNLNHSYSRDLVISLLEEFGVTPGLGQIVFDPFCGTGTTLLAAREAGVQSLGLDMMPLSAFISRGKVLNYSPEKTACDFEHIFPMKQYDFGFETAEPYLQKCFPPEELTKLLHLRYTISQMPDPERSFFAIALLNILKPISFTKNDGAFLRFTTDVVPKSLEEVFPPQVKMMLDDLALLAGTNGNGHHQPVIIRGDARVIPLADDSIACVITSPPYLNRHDYTRIYAIELLFSFLEDNEQLKQLRYKMLRSNVEAKNSVEVEGYTPPSRLQKLFGRLKNCDLPNRKVLDMVWGYFEDMFGVLKELHRVCRPGSSIAFVVGNCKYGGIMFPVDELLAEIGENAGLTAKKIVVARYRGNAPQQMREFGKESSRESIVIWERVK